MNKITPSISVIIPTHNRSASLKRNLDALKLQTYPLQEMEVIVVADGCNDGTLEMLCNYEVPFALKVIEQPGQGAATARNQGAASATGSLLLFLDDDIEASPHLVEAHIKAHQFHPELVVIGYLPPRLQNSSSFFHIQLGTWWETKFQSMRQLGHRYTYEDLLSGNFSLEAELFQRIGGFNTTFRCREDYELGARLIKAGADFVFAHNALGYHHDEVTNLDRSLSRKRNEGRADILFGRCHPDLIPNLRLYYFGTPVSWLDRLIIFLSFSIPALTDLLAAGSRWLLNVLESLRMRGFWQNLNERLHGYWYFRGVVDELKTHKGLASFLQGGSIRPDQSGVEIELDLQEGLSLAEQQLDKKRPAAARLRYGQYAVGRIPCQSGAERLRGVHLRPILAHTLAFSLLQALAMEGAINKFTSVD
ncbi:glycoside hydrolase family 2 protein [Nostoc sp. T09]|uniref:glycosyltransferase n=1 Tax=Nostoc sp. T09 TaxID=1932621 RepID=UPI000A3D5916|nr:glycosyltransferase family 2 protein [Nostoc sp. T09]OUL28416.1 glycoside hydrolase family 2 protein [Nostoc sp. T09]